MCRILSPGAPAFAAEYRGLTETVLRREQDEVAGGRRLYHRWLLKEEKSTRADDLCGQYS